MEVLTEVNNQLFNIMSSGFVQIVYFAVILICMLIITRAVIKEKFTTSYTSGATQRFFSELSQPNQGVEDFDPKNQVYTELANIRR